MGASMDGKTNRFATARVLAAGIALIVAAGVYPREASAAVVEISGMIAFTSANFGDGYSSSSRRYTGSIDFKFTPVSALEFEYTDSSQVLEYPTDLGGRLSSNIKERDTYKDIIYSFNWVQNLVSSKWILQPYVVIGGGRLNRRITQEFPQYGFRQDTSQNVLTGTGGAGVRLFLTRSMAIKGELKAYVPNFQFAKWKDNEALSIGLSWAF
jgi:hypothetical protein